MISPTLEAEIEKVDLQIKELKRYRRQLGIQRGALKRTKYDAELRFLHHLVKECPGIDREGIRYHYPDLTDQKLSTLLTKARRDHKLIINRGTTVNSAWFPVEGASYGPSEIL